MKIIALTMVGNENEIIESFIRYNFNFIDRMKRRHTRKLKMYLE